MNLDREDFGSWFAELHDGHVPFAWQERLLDAVLEKGLWPAQVVAPTGAGKTAVIDVHVFAQALTTDCDGPRPPRRLAMVVDRRVLVDDQYRYASLVANRLAATGDVHPVVAAVAERLWSLHCSDTPARDGRSPLVLGRMRGGVPPSRSWRDDPTAAAIICATPDMWGSRLLFRGYGSSSNAWPREAGLLAFDSVVVVDEAHLARQLVCTARRVAQLAPVAERPLPIIPLQVVETTATPSGPLDGVNSLGVEEGDLVDENLAGRLRRPKPVTSVPVKDWDSGRSVRVPKAMADAVEGLLPGRDGVDAAPTVGCFVNTVARAVAVSEELRSRSLRVVTVCGQARPVDVDLLETTYPGLLTPRGNDRVDVLVSTQSLEVGVDLDLAAMVTELASGSALAQRAGRVNRRGLRPDGPITVIVPEAEVPDRSRSGPYADVELRAALEWIGRRSADPDGLSPWALQQDPAPRPELRRTLLQRPELGQAWRWARTSDDLAAEPELELWLSDDFDDDTSVGIVVRDRLPDDPAEGTELIRLLPPRRHEVFSVPFRTTREVIAGLAEQPDLRAIVVRGEETASLQWREADDRTGTPMPMIRPGDVVVLDATTALFTPSDDGSPPVVVPLDRGRPTVTRYPAPDRLEAQALLPEQVWSGREVGGVVLRVEFPSDEETPDPRLQAMAEDRPAPERRAAVRAWLDDLPEPTRMQRSARALLDRPVRDADVVARPARGQPRRILVVDRRRAAVDEAVRQVWTPRGHEVALHAHQSDVAHRAARLAEGVGLGAELVEIVRLAGAHHDDGKQDPRFQRGLGAVATELAKSPGGTTVEQSRRNFDVSGLPTGWRHEQRSVVDCWDALVDCLDRELVARLVGTSHGRGRVGFPHTAAGLLPDPDPQAVELFDLGGWDELVERTQLRFGVWGCAFLEALLRCADGQISGEGR